MTHTNPNEGRSISQFLTPEAMVTPGVAGSLTMLITNALATSLAFPRAWTGLVLSFICGSLVLVSEKSLLTKMVFYLLNSLVIFVVAQGANSVGVNNARIASISLIGEAYASVPEPVWRVADAAQLKSQLDALSAQSAAITQAIDAARQNGAPQSDIDSLTSALQTIETQRNQILLQLNAPAAPQSFFSPWKF